MSNNDKTPIESNNGENKEEDELTDLRITKYNLDIQSIIKVIKIRAVARRKQKKCVMENNEN